MSIGYNAVVFLGKGFDYADEAKEFYKKHMPLTEEKVAVLDDTGLEDLLWSEVNGLRAKTLDCYSGSGFVLGFDLEYILQEPETFSEKVLNLTETWKEYFDEEPEIICTVQIC